MKILWAVNNLPPRVASEFGLSHGHAISWVDAMSEKLKDNDTVELYIAAPSDVKKLEHKKINNIDYYVFPLKKKSRKYWDKIINDVKPELIHVYGTESSSNYELIKYYSNYPILISIQGVLNEYYHHYYAGLTISEILKTTTIGDILFRRSIIYGRFAFKRRAKKECESFRAVKYVEGRSTWDRCATKKINPDLKYYFCPRMIRAPFYEKEWRPDEMEKYSIFVHQGDYPIKGLHILLDALYEIKKSIPAVKLYMSGNSFLERKGLKSRLLTNGYQKYIIKKIKTLGLKENIVFTGFLSANQIADKLAIVNACVSSSAIENASNSVVESMLVGTPCVASYVGGNPEILDDGKYGILYAFDEPNLLAEKLIYVFNHTEEMIEISSKAREIAGKRHSPDFLEKTLLEIYSDIIRIETKAVN